jgi:dTDP-6-deoxy-L-talose 4-dehydrogenase (NAD+)
MRIAVTGASGFIGRAVLRELSRRGIVAVASSRSGFSTMSTDGHQWVTLDHHDRHVDPFETLGKPEIVIHLAWSGLPNYRSLHHFETELPAQYEFLKKLAQRGVRKLLVAGTCFEYGLQSGPLEESLPTNPATPYGLAKDMLRRMLEFLRLSQPYELIWARLFYLYGEDQAATSLYSQLRQAVMRGDQSFPMSGGEQLRDYLPVAEAARLIVSLAFIERTVGVVNICSGRPISVRRLVETWIRDNGWRIDLNLGYYPYPDYEPMAFWGTRNKLERILGDC